MPLSVALLVCLHTLIVAGPATGATFQVAFGDVYGPNGLVAAIKAANGNSDPENQILLQAGSFYPLTRPDNFDAGPNGLPTITKTLLISSVPRRTRPAIILRFPFRSADFRIFHVSSQAQLFLTDVAVSNGAAGLQNGGAILNHGDTVLIKSALLGNHGRLGGAIFNSANATLRLENALIKGNTSTNGGGGIYNMGETLIFGSTIDGNVNDFSGGGGFSNVGGDALLENSTVSNNHSSAGAGSTGGGGISNVGATLTISNSTISGNKVLVGNGVGGGIFNSGAATLVLENVTITDNFAQLQGGGLFNFSPSTVNWRNSIVAKNGGQVLHTGRFIAIEGPDCFGALISGGFNLLGNNADCSFSPAAGDQMGTAPDPLTGVGPLNPRLAPLQDNGGLTMTHALATVDEFGLRVVNPAIDRGAPDCGTADDQRGYARPVDGNGDGTKVCDIGAFEFGVRQVTAALERPIKHSDPTISPGDIAGCPANSFGKFRFTATLTNATNDKSLSDLFVEIQSIGDDNLVLTPNGKLLGVKDRFMVARAGGFSDGILRTRESVDVPFVICMKANNGTSPLASFFVHIFGISR